MIELYGSPLWHEASIGKYNTQEKLIIPFIKNNQISTIVYYDIFDSNVTKAIIIDGYFMENATSQDKFSASIKYLKLKQKGYALERNMDDFIQKTSIFNYFPEHLNLETRRLNEYDYEIDYILPNSLMGENWETVNYNYSLEKLHSITEELINEKFYYILSSNFEMSLYTIKLKFNSESFSWMDWYNSCEIIDIFMRDFELKLVSEYKIISYGYTDDYGYDYPLTLNESSYPFLYFADFQRNLYALLENNETFTQVTNFSYQNSIITNQRIAITQLKYLKTRGDRELAEIFEELLSDHTMPMSDVNHIYMAIEKAYMQLKGQYMMAIFSPEHIASIFSFCYFADVTSTTQRRILEAYKAWGKRYLQKSNNYLSPLYRGSTGRRKALDLNEELAMVEIMSDPSKGIKIKYIYEDPRWYGWIKMSNKNAHRVEIHYVGRWENGILKAVDDFKFVD